MTSPPKRLRRSPPGGPSRDTKGQVDLSSPDEEPGHWPGAACKARQWPGEAGSTASA